MICRRQPDGTLVTDRAWLAAFYGLKPETIRKRWTPATYDRNTGAALYEWDEDEANAMHDKTRNRKRVAAA